MSEAATFGQLIKRARERQGLTQREVAERIQATDAYISALENNRKSPPPYATVVALAQALGLDPEQLWKVALKEREERAIRRARGRELLGIMIDGTIDEALSEQLRSLIIRMERDPEFFHACLQLSQIFADPDRREAILKTIAALAKAQPA